MYSIAFTLQLSDEQHKAPEIEITFGQVRIIEEKTDYLLSFYTIFLPIIPNFQRHFFAILGIPPFAFPDTAGFMLFLLQTCKVNFGFPLRKEMF